MNWKNGIRKVFLSAVFCCFAVLRLSGVTEDESVYRSPVLLPNQNALVSEDKKTSDLRTFLGEYLFPKVASIDVTPLIVEYPPDRTVADDVHDLFAMIRQESPALFEQLDSANRMKLLEVLLNAAETGIRPMNEENMMVELNSIMNENRSAKYYSPVLIASNHILYIRVENLDGVVDPDGKLREELRAVARLSNKPTGIVVDLRTASGDNYRSALELLSFFTSVRDLPPQKNSLVNPWFDVPLAVLTGKNTYGSAEIFAALIEKRKQGITIGEETAGHPVMTKKGSAAGMTWLIPDIPLKEIEAHAHIPVIRTETTPQIAFDELRKTPQSMQKDPCLSRAVDLLLSLDALRLRGKVLPLSR